MLQMSSTIADKEILSLRAGAPIAKTTGVLFNPDNLKMEGFYCEDLLDKKQLILLDQDVRDILPQGIVVNDHDVLADPTDLVRLQKLLDLGFELIGMHVETVSGDKVGKVTDYAFEGTTMYVQKIYVSQSILKSFTGGNLSIDRTQIHEITPKKIIINELLQTAPAGAPAAA